jgi:hypothetical protein
VATYPAERNVTRKSYGVWETLTEDEEAGIVQKPFFYTWYEKEGEKLIALVEGEERKSSFEDMLYTSNDVRYFESPSKNILIVLFSFPYGSAMHDQRTDQNVVIDVNQFQPVSVLIKSDGRTNEFRRLIDRLERMELPFSIENKESIQFPRILIERLDSADGEKAVQVLDRLISPASYQAYKGVPVAKALEKLNLRTKPKSKSKSDWEIWYRTYGKAYRLVLDFKLKQFEREYRNIMNTQDPESD